MGLENPIHLLVLAVIILLVFGSSQLPKIARSAGKHARETKEGVAKFKDEFAGAMGDDNPLVEVADTLRSANPRTIVRNTVDNAVRGDTPSETVKATRATGPARSSRPQPKPRPPKTPPSA
ncbi:MAG TPA: twin-arginine translocase TatA/TatE family subunit [Gaiellales bacterium]|jgi:TatA/E family protein of Tat protein translocase